MQYAASAIRSMLRRYPNTLAGVLGVVLLLALLGTVEVALRVREGFRDVAPDSQQVRDHFGRVVVVDPQLSFAGVPNADYTDTLTCDGVVLHSARYRLGSDGFRVTPAQPDAPDACSAFFFGCSFTFGFGLEDDESLPAQFAAAQPGLWVKNYAFPGYGLQQFWLLLQRPEVVERLSAAQGIVMYVHIDHHMNRLIGTPDIKDWYAAMPWLYLRDGVVTRGGDFDDRDWIANAVEKGLSRFYLYHFAEIRVRRLLPSIESQCTSESNRALYTAVVRDARERLRRINPDLAFCFVVYPGAAQAKPICAALAAADIRTLDYSSLFEGRDAAATPIWFSDGMGVVSGHPTAASHAIVVEQLVQDLPRLFPERMAACEAASSGS